MLGGFYFCQGVLSGYCCMCVSGYCCVWERGDLSELYGVFRNVANSRAVVTLFGGDWLLLSLMMVSTQRDVKLII